MISKAEFSDFKNSSIYQEMSSEFMGAVLRATEEVITRSTVNVDRDQFLKGYMNGIQAVMDWQPEFVEDDVSDAEER